MPVRPPTFRPRGARSKREIDRDRGTSIERGYDARWRHARRAYLVDHPLCEYCDLDGVVTAASLVDHLYPHRRHANVFWIEGWWVASCTPCHSVMKQRVEQAGKPALDALARRLGRDVMRD